MPRDELAAEANRPGDFSERLAYIEVREQTFPAGGSRVEDRTEMRLRVEVHEQRHHSPPRERRAQVEHGRRLADPALLIEYRQARSHAEFVVLSYSPFRAIRLSHRAPRSPLSG